MSADDRADELSAAQLRAVEVLLAGGEATAAAEAAGVSDRTVRRWRRDPVFVRAVRVAGRARASEAASLMLGAQADALAVLRAALDDPSANVRVRAAVALLQLGQVAREDDHDERLDALERRQLGEERGWHTTPAGRPVWPA